MTSTSTKDADVIDDRYLTRGDIAAIARCSTRTIARAEARGHLRAIRPPGSNLIRYEVGEVRRWLGLEVAS